MQLEDCQVPLIIENNVTKTVLFFLGKLVRVAVVAVPALCSEVRTSRSGSDV